MADITTFYPGGGANPVPNAVNATNAVNADQVDRELGSGDPADVITFWSGTQAEYDALATDATPTPGLGYDPDTLYIIHPDS